MLALPNHMTRTRRTCRAIVTLLALSATAVALAGEGADEAEDTPEMTLHDLPHTDGNWQEGEAVIPAPANQIRAWLVDYARWPERFSDVQSAEVLGQTSDGAAIVRFRSRIADRTITIHEWQTDWGLRYEGQGGDVSTRGRIFLVDQGDGSTRVIMQSTSEVHGFLRLFATKGVKRKSAFNIMRAHLTSLWTLGLHRCHGNASCPGWATAGHKAR